MWGLLVQVIGGLLLIAVVFFCVFPELLWFFLEGNVNGEGNPSKRATSPDRDAELKNLIGRRGRSKSPLQLAGKVEIDGDLYEAMSDDGFVECGTFIRVIDIRGVVVIVEPIGG